MCGIGLVTKEQLMKKLVDSAFKDGNMYFSVSKQLANPYLGQTGNR